MAWYPDWLVALDECAKDDTGVKYGRGIVSPRNARDIIDELTALKQQNKRLREIERAYVDAFGEYSAETHAIIRTAATNVTSGAPRDDPGER